VLDAGQVVGEAALGVDTQRHSQRAGERRHVHQ
jgi:hypothetical protein